MNSEEPRHALTAYLDLGWPAEERDGSIELITGTVVDALEVPSAAGILAASWWCYSEGHPDTIRCLPSLPDPRQALALIAAGDRHFFLVRAGECPWQTQDPVVTAVAAMPAAAVIRWHSRGSRIPAPPGTLADGRSGADRGQADQARAAWVHLPDRGVRLPSAAILLHLLATAATATRLGPHMLALDGGVLAVPAFGEPLAAWVDGPAGHSRTSAHVAFGFSAPRPPAFGAGFTAGEKM